MKMKHQDGGACVNHRYSRKAENEVGDMLGDLPDFEPVNFKPDSLMRVSIYERNKQRSSTRAAGLYASAKRSAGLVKGQKNLIPFDPRDTDYVDVAGSMGSPTISLPRHKNLGNYAINKSSATPHALLSPRQPRNSLSPAFVASQHLAGSTSQFQGYSNQRDMGYQDTRKSLYRSSYLPSISISHSFSDYMPQMSPGRRPTDADILSPRGTPLHQGFMDSPKKTTMLRRKVAPSAATAILFTDHPTDDPTSLTTSSAALLMSLPQLHVPTHPTESGKDTKDWLSKMEFFDELGKSDVTPSFSTRECYKIMSQIDRPNTLPSIKTRA